MAGDLRATVNAAGDGLTLARSDGSLALSYTGLVAYDSTGRTLPASLEVRPDGIGQKVLRTGQAPGILAPEPVPFSQDLLIHVDAAGAQGAITIDPFVQQAKLTASDGVGLSRVAISGDTVVAADTGGGYVFVKPSSGWADMTQVAKLTATDVGNIFGISVAIDGDTVVIGDSYAPGPGLGPGAAYVFVKPSSGWTDMTQTAKLTVSDAVDVDRLGFSVGIDGDTIVVGASSKWIGGEWNVGAAYVFEKPASGWTDMTQTAELTAANGLPLRLGFSVGISGDTVIAGTYRAGAAYVFVKPASGWADASETATLTASDGSETRTTDWPSTRTADSSPSRRRPATWRRAITIVTMMSSCETCRAARQSRRSTVRSCLPRTPPPSPALWKRRLRTAGTWCLRAAGIPRTRTCCRTNLTCTGAIPASLFVTGRPGR